MSSCDVNSLCVQGDVWRFSVDVPSVSGAGSQAIDSIIGELERRSWNEQDLFAVRLALDEAVMNAIEHGNRRDPSKTVGIKADVGNTKARIAICDEGNGFCVKDVPDPLACENLECPTGRGLFLIRSFMTKVWHNEKGNVVYMEKEHVCEQASEA